MKNLLYIIIGMALFAIVQLSFNSNNTSIETSSVQEPTFERIMKTGKIRCGYATWKPNLWVEPNSGEIKGFDHDIMERIGALLGLEIEWTEETGWGVAEQGLENGRYDMVCADVCMDPRRSRAAYFSLPYTHNPQLAFVRKGEKTPLKSLNTKEKTMVIIPNTIFEDIGTAVFPKTQKVNISDLSGDSNVILSVVTGKADFGIATYPALKEYMKHNPNKVDIIEEPADYCLGSFMIPRGENQLKHLIDNSLTRLIVSGELETIMEKHIEITPLSWRRPALTFEK